MSELMSERLAARKNAGARTAIAAIATIAASNVGTEGHRLSVQDYTTHEWLRWCSGDDDADLVPVNPSAVYVDQENRRLIFQERDEYGDATNTGNTRHMAVHIGPRCDTPLILLNGDGMDIRRAAALQERLRIMMRELVGMSNVMLIPFMALNAVSVDFQTLLPIDITEDTQRSVRRLVPKPPAWDRDAWIRNPDARRTSPMHEPEPAVGQVDIPSTERWEIREANVLYDLTTVNNAVNRWMVWGHTLEGAGPPAWQQLQGEINSAHITEFDQEESDNYPPEDRSGWERRPVVGEHWWVENRHMLGAVVFSAKDAITKKRHRWLSAFDQNEPTPLYFLAQLPDKGEVETYADALHLLCPAIVHEARAEGRIVERQGDIFFMETNLTTEQVYERTKWRLRRDVVMFDLAAQIGRIATGMSTEPQPAEGEVREQVECPCGCGHKRWVGSGPRARRLLSIYRTGHTATEVAVMESGTTFVRGTVFHDPTLETEGRVPDHEPRALGDSEAWFLAVRNEVPRATPTRPTQATDSLVDSFLSLGNKAHRNRRDHRRLAEESKKVREAAEAAKAIEEAEQITEAAAEEPVTV